MDTVADASSVCMRASAAAAAHHCCSCSQLQGPCCWSGTSIGSSSCTLGLETLYDLPAIRSFITRLSLRLGPTYAWPLRTNSRGSVYSHPVRAPFKASPIVPLEPGTCSKRCRVRQKVCAGALHGV